MRTAPILFKAIRRMAGVAALATLAPTLAWAADAPVPAPDKGDIIYGYSLAFTADNEFIGGLSRLFPAGTFNASSGALSTIGTFDKSAVLNELVYVGFQATFAAITCCLILGALVERVKFSAILLFLAFWFPFCYCPVAHMVWYVPGRTPTRGRRPATWASRARSRSACTRSAASSVR
jgi:Ammonium Transporter Family